MTIQADTDRTARNIQLVQAGYDAFTRGDLAALEQLFHPEVVWHAQRLGALSGDHKGWPELLRFFGGTMELSKGTFRVTVTEHYANPDGVACMVRSQADRDGRVLDDHPDARLPARRRPGRRGLAVRRRRPGRRLAG